MSKTKIIATLVLCCIVFNASYHGESLQISMRPVNVNAADSTPAATTPEAKPATPTDTKKTDGTKQVEPSTEAGETTFWGCLGSAFDCVIKGALYGVIVFFGWLVWVAATVVEWVVDPGNMAKIGDSVVYTIWKAVRDILNLMFIFVLLFSAFATIFQAKEFHIKKVLLSVVIAALLVNFSFPISRFIIDSSNMAMYFIMDQAFQTTSGAAMTGKIADGAKMTNALISQSVLEYDYSYLFMCILFMALFAFTFLMIAVLFLIRLTALIILVMFSSVGFVCGILPSTKQYASDWWKNLFKWAFMAPILMLMIAVSVKILNEMKLGTSMGASSSGLGTSNSGNVLGQFAQYMVPIVILWMGISAAIKIGKESAGFIVGGAEKFAKWYATKLPQMAGKGAIGLAGGAGGALKGGATGGWRGAMSGFGSGFRYGYNAPGGVVKTAKDIQGSLKKSGESAQEDISGFLRGKGSQISAKRRAEQVSLWEKEGTPESEVRKALAGGNLAAAEYMAKNGKIRNAKDVKDVLKVAEKDQDVYKKVVEKISKDGIQDMSATDFNKILADTTQSQSLRKSIAANMGVKIDDSKVDNELSKIQQNIEKKFTAEGRMDLVIESRVAKAEQEAAAAGRSFTSNDRQKIVENNLLGANAERLKAQNWSNYISVQRGDQMIQVKYDENTQIYSDANGNAITDANEANQLNTKMAALTQAIQKMSDDQKKEMTKGMSAKEYAQLQRITRDNNGGQAVI